ncbi:MAG: hypothetical protein ABSF40_09970 [Candidatus Acidiferrales bacterium]|jgi:hypothetical protein
MKRRFSFIVLSTLLLFFAASARAQDSTGPLAPPPKYEVKRLPSEPHPGPPPVPEQEIIQKLAANEDVMKQKYETYDFTQTIRIEEMADPGGKFSVTGEVYTRPDGQRYMRVDKQPESDLKVEHFSLEDARTIASLPLFALTSREIGNYNFKYAGQEKLDQLTTYVFQVKPKLLSRKQRFFEGVIWVDDHDFAIVKSYGKFVSEISGNGTSLPFTMFETYRENFQGKYWLPTYTRSDDYVKGPNDEELPLRLVMRSTEFKLHDQPEEGAVAAPSAAPATAPKPSQPQPPSPN